MLPGEKHFVGAMAVGYIECRFTLRLAAGRNAFDTRALFYLAVDLIAEMWWAAIHHGLIDFKDHGPTEPIDHV